MTPHIQLGGTSVDELIDQRKNALQSCYDTIAALAKCVPNGRDFPPKLLSKASAEHKARIQAVAGIAADLQSELFELDQRRS